MTHIIGLRLVHDIVLLKNRRHPNSAAVIAFVQHGNVEEGWKYETVCPFCQLTCGYILDPEDELTAAQLHQQVYQQTREHLYKCTASGFKIMVQKATHPLNTETVKKEM